MKIFLVGNKRKAYALLCVMVITAIAVSLYAGMNQSSVVGAVQNDRNNTFNQAVAAAEGASESVLSHISRDFLNQSYNPSMLGTYATYLPPVAWASNYCFSDGDGTPDKLWVTGSPTTINTNLDSQFRGLYGLVYTCCIKAQAKPLDKPYAMAAAVQQDLQLASIPIFQFAIFYAMDLEINPGPQMDITGKVHSNANIYMAPGNRLRFLDDVAAAGEVFFNRHPDDPTGGSKVMPEFTEPYMENVSSLTLPIATNNSPEVVRGILEEPPFGEDPNSPTGKHRYYNNCDLIVTTLSDTNVTVTLGHWNGTPTKVNFDVGTNAYSFISTTNSFKDRRENKYTIVTELDVSKLKQWMDIVTGAGKAYNLAAKAATGHEISSVYIQDKRVNASKLTVVRVTEGKALPPDGLTVATKHPLYVQGHFNAPNTTPGYADTSATKPASLVGDAITILSSNWNDSTSATAMNVAANTTVNAAFLAGIVPSANEFGTRHYSGGVENFPRFLESWSSRKFTYNGSMVVMFPSQFATAWWKNPANYPTGYYQAPTRLWAFDINFLDHNKLPPATPQVRKLIRGQWRVVASN